MGKVDNITVLIPWDGKNREWLDAAIESCAPYNVIVRRGMGTAGNGLNKALSVAPTDYVFVMASDDLLYPDTIDRLSDAIGTADFAYPSLEKFGDDDGTFRADVFSLHRLQKRNFIPGCFLGKTATIRRLKGWNEEAPFEDWDFHYRAAMSGAKYVPVPDALYRYRIHGTSLSQRIETIARDQSIYFEDVRNATVGRAYQVYATFYCDLSAGTSYVRSVLPAKYLPAIARSSLPGEAEGTDHPPVAIFQYPSPTFLMPIPLSMLGRSGSR